MPESTIFPLRWVEPHRQVTVRQVHEHAEVARLNAVSHGLQRVHLEGDLGLKFIEGAIVRAEPEPPVLFGDHEHR